MDKRSGLLLHPPCRCHHPRRALAEASQYKSELPSRTKCRWWPKSTMRIATFESGSWKEVPFSFVFAEFGEKSLSSIVATLLPPQYADTDTQSETEAKSFVANSSYFPGKSPVFLCQLDPEPLTHWCGLWQQVLNRWSIYGTNHPKIRSFVPKWGHAPSLLKSFPSQHMLPTRITSSNPCRHRYRIQTPLAETY